MTTNLEKDTELFERIKDIFNEKIPFNKVLGLRVLSVDYDSSRLRFDMQEALIGNYVRGNLHGGVISSVIDVAGGLTAFLGLQKRLSDESVEKKIERFSKLGTIDLRIDYLRPGYGNYFECTGHTLRTGNKVAVTRMELRNDAGQLIAVGTGAYVIS